MSDSQKGVVANEGYLTSALSFSSMWTHGFFVLSHEEEPNSFLKGSLKDFYNYFFGNTYIQGDSTFFCLHDSFAVEIEITF